MPMLIGLDDEFERYRTILRDRNMRITPQRLMILRVIDQGHGHMTAEDIGEQIRSQYPAVHQGTIYRTLEALRLSGLVSETHLANRSAIYDLVSGHQHHHLICERCGAITEIDDSLLESLRSALLDRFGFHARIEHFAIAGSCVGCSGKEHSLS